MDLVICLWIVFIVVLFLLYGYVDDLEQEVKEREHQARLVEMDRKHEEKLAEMARKHEKELAEMGRKHYKELAEIELELSRLEQELEEEPVIMHTMKEERGRPVRRRS